MGYIKIDVGTDNINGDIDIKIRVNCTDNELQVACANLMGLVASQQGLKVIEELTTDLQGALNEGADNTKEHS